MLGVGQQPIQVIADPTQPRSVINYGLQRRSVLRSLLRGRPFDGVDVCDADPYLIKAARFHGVVAEDSCPICRADALSQVTYIYGEQLGHVSGAAVHPRRLAELAVKTGEFRVYVVEVCPDCRWNHLLTSYFLGDGVTRKAPRRPRDLLD